MNTGSNIVKQLRDKIAYLRGELARREWIPCSVRLPDTERTMLVWIPEYQDSFKAWWSEGLNEWTFFQKREGDATHWQDLPQPPEL